MPTLHSGYGVLGGVITAHAVYGAPGRCGSGAEVKILHTCRIVTPGGSKEELTEIDDAASDITADQVGVHSFEIGGRKRVALENGFAKAWGEAFDLTLDL